MQIVIRRKPARRKFVIRSSEDVWAFMRQHEIAKVIPDGNVFRFLTRSNELLEPRTFFRRLASDINQKKHDNNVRQRVFRPSKPGGWMSDFNRGHFVEIDVPIDKEFHTRLIEGLEEVNDFFMSWQKLSERVRLGIEQIPTELRFERDASQTGNKSKDRTRSASTGRKPKKKKVPVSKALFADNVLRVYKDDQNEAVKEKQFKDLQDAVKQIYKQYTIPASWHWTTKKCYQYVLKRHD